MLKLYQTHCDNAETTTLQYNSFVHVQKVRGFPDGSVFNISSVALK